MNAPTAEPRAPFHRRWWRRLYWLRRDWRNLRLLKRPGTAVFAGTGGIGDELLITPLVHELAARNRAPINIFVRHPDLFANNPDVATVMLEPANLRLTAAAWELPLLRPVEWQRNITDDRQESPQRHIIAEAAIAGGLRGTLPLRPYLFLSAEEKTVLAVTDKPAIAIQSSGKGARYFFRNKEWGAQNFDAVVRDLKAHYAVVQIGLAEDPLLDGVTDLRGRLSLRQTASVLSQVRFFIGQVGFLMHLARSVDCRSVIVFGGRELPSQAGYPCNENLSCLPPCAPCWQKNECAFERKCLTQILPDDVIEAVRRIEERLNQPMEITLADLG